MRKYFTRSLAQQHNVLDVGGNGATQYELFKRTASDSVDLFNRARRSEFYRIFFSDTSTRMMHRNACVKQAFFYIRVSSKPRFLVFVVQTLAASLISFSISFIVSVCS